MAEKKKDDLKPKDEKALKGKSKFIDTEPELEESFLGGLVFLVLDCNPPSSSDEKLFNTAANTALQKGAHLKVFLTDDMELSDDTPLTFHQNYNLAKEVFGSSLHHEPVEDFIDVLESVSSQYSSAYYVTESDYADDDKKLYRMYDKRELSLDKVEIIGVKLDDSYAHQKA